MKVSTENDNNFGYEKITILVDNIPLIFHFTFINVSFFSGWHNRLNTVAKYILILDLLQEVDVVDSSVRADDLERDIHRRYTILEKKIQSTLYQYMEGEVITIH